MSDMAMFHQFEGISDDAPILYLNHPFNRGSALRSKRLRRGENQPLSHRILGKPLRSYNAPRQDKNLTFFLPAPDVSRSLARISLLPKRRAVYARDVDRHEKSN